MQEKKEPAQGSHMKILRKRGDIISHEHFVRQDARWLHIGSAPVVEKDGKALPAWGALTGVQRAALDPELAREAELRTSEFNAQGVAAMAQAGPQ